MIRRILAVIIAWAAILAFSSCGSSAPKNPPSGLTDRVLASQSVTSAVNFGALYIINGELDTIPRVSPIAAGNAPGTMAINPSRSIVSAFDSSSYAIYSVNTATEKSIGSVQLPRCQVPPQPCPTPSFVVPTSNEVGYAALPSASVTGYSFLGGVEVMNLAGGIQTTIAVNNAQTVVPASSGGELLVFSNDSNSVTILTPQNAQPQVDLSCLSGVANTVCTVIPGFDHPVNAVVNNNIAYILNCGPQCGGTLASVMILNLSTLQITATIPVDAAYIGLLSGSTLYVAGTSPTNNTCANQTTAATTCGRLDTIDLTTNTVTSSLAITDGYHSHIDISIDGQLFVGSYDCTEINNGNTSTGEVRGCLTILDTNTGALVFPPENGEVDGLQSFTTRRIEYVAQGGNLYVYNTQYDLLLINTYILQGQIVIVGYVGDVKAIDFF